MTDVADRAPAGAVRAGAGAAGAAGDAGDAARPRSRRWWALAALLVAVALVARLAYMEATPSYELRHDAIDYDAHAQSIARGGGYSDTFAHGRPTAFRPPAYPYFLGAVYRLAGVQDAPAAQRVHAARVAQALVGTAIVALLGLLALELWGARLALVALALGAVYVPLITVGGAVMGEPLFDALMLGALCAAVAARRSPRALRWAAAAGALAGLSILTRPNALVLLLPLAVGVWTGRPWRSWRAAAPAAMLVAVALATLVPWTVRNAVVLHAFVPLSTQLGSALAGTYNDQARTDPVRPAAWRSIGHVPEYAEVWRHLDDIPEADLERRLRADSLRYIREHPAYVAKVGYWNTVRILDLAGARQWRATASTISIGRGWADAGVVCFWAFALVAIGGASTHRFRRTPRFLWAFPVLLALSVVFLTTETPRYRTPIDPFVVLLAALAVVAVAERVARRRDR